MSFDFDDFIIWKEKALTDGSGPNYEVAQASSFRKGNALSSRIIFAQAVVLQM